MQLKRSHDEVEAQDLPTHRPKRTAVDKAGVQQYEQFRNKTTEHTIPLHIWNTYWADHPTVWSEHIKHKLYSNLEPAAQKTRTHIIASIETLTGPGHTYYLCIPVEKRHQKALPADSRDCSSSVLIHIRNALQLMQREKASQPAVVAGSYSLLGKVRRTVLGALRPWAGVEIASLQAQVPEYPPPSPTTAWHDEQVAEKRQQMTRAQREFATARRARTDYHNKKAMAATAKDGQAS